MIVGDCNIFEVQLNRNMGGGEKGIGLGEPVSGNLVAAPRLDTDSPSPSAPTTATLRTQSSDSKVVIP